MRHANPASVWVRFAVLPLIVLSVWSRRWIGRRSLLPLGVSLVFTVVEPLLFPPPRSTRNWASRGVLGERIWADRTAVDLPEQFRSTAVPNTTYAFQCAGMAALVRGLVVFDLRSVVGGLLLVQCAKAWSSTGWCCCSGRWPNGTRGTPPGSTDRLPRATRARTSSTGVLVVRGSRRAMGSGSGRSRSPLPVTEPPAPGVSATRRRWPCFHAPMSRQRGTPRG